jgi:hypothetical protein
MHGSARQLGKAGQGTYSGQCKAHRQGNARHLGKAVQGTEQDSTIHHDWAM